MNENELFSNDVLTMKLMMENNLKYILPLGHDFEYTKSVERTLFSVTPGRAQHD